MKAMILTIATLLVTGSAFAASPLKIECHNTNSKEAYLYNITAEVASPTQLVQVLVVVGAHGQVWTSHHESITEQNGTFIFNESEGLKIKAGLLEQALRSNEPVQFKALTLHSAGATDLTCVSK